MRNAGAIDMDARRITTAADARELVQARGLSHVKLGVTDIDGVMRGKYMARDKFFSALESGFKFCDVIFGWDSSDQLYDKATFTGWHTAYPDATALIDPTTCRDVPLEGDMLFFLGEFEGAAEAVCPRRLLRRVIDRAAKTALPPKSLRNSNSSSLTRRRMAFARKAIATSRT
jgi:glutamine synthetase